MDQATRKTWHSWRAMRSRCTYARDVNFPNYGGRGIQVCARWVKFDAFVADMGLRPEGMTLDRIDNDGDYEPGNCRWATRLVQNRNSRRCGPLIEFRGRTQSVHAWTMELGLGVNTLQRRLRSGWPIERALTTPSLASKEVCHG